MSATCFLNAACDCVGSDLLAPRLVHVSEQAADKSLVCLHDPREFLIERFRFDSRANPVKHEPRGFLRDADRAVQLVTRNAVLAIDEHPDRHQPLVESDRRVLEDRSDTDRILFFAALALPKLARAQKRVVRRAAPRAAHAARPAHFDREFKGVLRVREVSDCVLKGFRLMTAHTGNVGPKCR